MYHCGKCNRDFFSYKAWEQHVQTSNQHEYCVRCGKAFNSWVAFNQHRTASARHYECPTCDYDADGFDDLEDHREEEHGYCVHCGDDSFTYGLVYHKLWNHNMCHICDRCFESPNNLREHSKVHQPRNIECYACEGMFSSYSAMVLHLETGYCPRSNVDEQDVTDIALQCFASKRYRCTYGSGRNFECPTCPTQTRLISGLLQHVDSQSCGETLDHGSPLDRFLTFLAKRV